MTNSVANIENLSSEAQAAPSSSAAGPALGLPRRLRVDGKFFSRGGRRFRVKGVTYGPFAPEAGDEQFPLPGRVHDDFVSMRKTSINAIRTYHVPPVWLLDQADERELGVFVDVPWSKHLCFLDGERAQSEARQAVREAARRGRHHSCLLAYSVGNEIPPNVIRWHGARRVERFLAELRDVAKQADPDGLVTYANYPSTEYLDLAFLDFATFNVYLHDREAFQRYLFRLQNLVGDRPLLLGELGMDTLRHGENEQAEFLAGHSRNVALMGLAGSFVFSWTDDWHTGGQQIQDWQFGITDAERQPKAALHALREQFEARPAELLAQTPPVSVVVCSYNGGRTLEQCVRSLLALEYPNYEIIVVDDGSTDDTRAILSRFLPPAPISPSSRDAESSERSAPASNGTLRSEDSASRLNGVPTLRVIHQDNQGLSAARNAGMQAATGEIIAYTDADCYADADWLTHLVFQFSRRNAAAVGGPNLSPEDGWLAACVAAAPGQPTHVLVSDQEAEHIPGCNMAFRREALLAIRGFDPQFRKAGDDVDVCWRLQQAGYWITFAPGACVWHHRRQNPRAFFRQQAGYGAAEALLCFKHPDRFNSRGDGKWNGVLYGGSLPGLRLSGAIIYRGIFGTGLFQCLYQPAPAHWAALPGTLEWHAAAGALALAALAWPAAWIGVVIMLFLSGALAALQSFQARVAPQHDGWKSRLLVAGLCYLQPLVRSWSRYRTRLFSYRAPVVRLAPSAGGGQGLTLAGRRTAAYWSESGVDRLQLLGCVVRFLDEHRWGKTLDSGWDDWDLEIYCEPWTVVQVSTAEEDHGNGKYLVRVRYQLRPSGYWNLLAGAGIIAAALAGALWFWPAAATAGALLATCAGLWLHGTRRAARALAVIDHWADQFGLIHCTPSGTSETVLELSHQRKGIFRRLLTPFGRLFQRSKTVDGAGMGHLQAATAELPLLDERLAEQTLANVGPLLLQEQPIPLSNAHGIAECRAVEGPR